MGSERNNLKIFPLRRTHLFMWEGFGISPFEGVFFLFEFLDEVKYFKRDRDDMIFQG
jgi:hypothetical protein